MASTTTGTVVGFFTSEAQAETAVSALRAAGFQSSQIGVALASGDDVAEAPYTNARETAAPTAGTLGHETGATTASSVGHAAGEKTRNAWERFKGFFEGADVEPYADESSRGSNVSHEITAAGDYDYGHEDVAHSLSGLDVPEDRSRYFGHRFSSQGRGAVVTVTATGREAEAESILSANGGDVGADTTGYDYSAPAATAGQGQRRIQLLGEVLRVQKDRISRGEVRIRKERSSLSSRRCRSR